MQPESRDTYENGEASLYIDHFTDPLKNRYWVGSGIGSIQFTEQGFENLIELLKEYDVEENPVKRSLRKDDPWQFWTIIVAVLVLAFCITVTF